MTSVFSRTLHQGWLFRRTLQSAVGFRSTLVSVLEAHSDPSSDSEGATNHQEKRQVKHKGLTLAARLTGCCGW